MIRTPQKRNNMTEREAIRRPWTEKDKEKLIKYWENVKSVVLISILLNRPEGSVQTEASRLNLPRRKEDQEGENRHRKKWSKEEFEHLLKIVEQNKNEDKKIKIMNVAKETKRSVDAIVTRLSEFYGSREEVKNLIIATDSEILFFAEAKEKMRNEAKEKETDKPDKRKIAAMRTCLCCRKPFWSHGAGNRICPKCKSNEHYEWD